MRNVSVIVPIYNAEQHLAKCIKSIVKQTYENIELILVDDGSPDNCGVICDTWAEQDTRIHVIHKKNGGVSSARNAGIDFATGQYIMFVDSDDYISPDFIHRLINANSDLTLCGFVCRKENGQELFRTKFSKAFYKNKNLIPYTALYQKNMLYSPCCKLFRTDILRENHIHFPTNINWGEDGMFVADYLKHVNSLYILDYAGYSYIRYDDSNSLSTKVRPDIIKMVVQSREYCIEKMAQTAPWAKEAVAKVCEEDIRRNCADFIKMLLCSESISWNQKKKQIVSFLEDPYVAQTIASPQHYYAKHGKVYIAITQNTGKKIVDKYRLITAKNRLFKKLYQKVYLPLPEGIKKLYRKGKDKIQK